MTTIKKVNTEDYNLLRKLIQIKDINKVTEYLVEIKTKKLIEYLEFNRLYKILMNSNDLNKLSESMEDIE